MAERQEVIEIANNLYNGLVEKDLDGPGTSAIDISWGVETGPDGQLVSTPEVSIDGIPAKKYAKRILEYTTTNQSLIEEVGEEFNGITALSWGASPETSEERQLARLAPIMDYLADSREAGYRKKAIALLVDQGQEHPSQTSVNRLARRLACSSMVKWAAAVRLASVKTDIA